MTTRIGVASRFQGRWSTWANALSATRLLAAPLVFAAVRAEAAPVAAALVAFAIATDLADGPLARSRAESSPLGGLLDHVADATFVTCGLAALAVRGIVPGLLPLAVGVAFAQYAWDSRASRGRALRGSRLGRWNGIAYFVVLAVPVARDALALAVPGAGVVRLFGWLLVGSTALSVLARLRAAPR